MGEEKGLALYRNKPLIDYVIEAMQPLCTDLFIISSHPGYTYTGITQLADRRTACGPAAGIETMLYHTDAELNLLAACDMPCMTPDVFHYLLTHRQQADICVPVLEERPEPLLGCYHSRCLDQWVMLLDDGYRKLSDFLTHFHTTFVDGRFVPGFPDVFTNMNTKNDLSSF